MIEQLKEWWLDRWRVFFVEFSVAFSCLYVRLIILDYGLDFSIKLPYLLNNLNPINWLTKCVFRAVLMLFGVYDSISVYWYWRFGKWKYLELDVTNSYKLFSFSYCWNEHCDHWGHSLEIAVAGLEVAAKFNDTRHWEDIIPPADYSDIEEKDTKKIPGEER